MKAVTSQLKTLILNGNTVRAVPKAFAEWEHNRFSPLNPVVVTPAQAVDTEWSNVYDLQSVTNPNRPSSGIAKTRFASKLIATTSFKDQPSSSRFYIPTENDAYRYFSSTQKSSGSVTNGEYVFSTPLVVTVTHKSQVVANKLIIGFEQSYAKPKRFTIEVTPDGKTWTGVGNWATNSVGQVVLWRNGAGSWSDTRTFDGIAALQGVRVTVYSMDTANSHLDLIQMGLRLEDEVTDFVESYERNFEIADRSLLAPVGRASSNTGSLVLNNMDSRFDNENEASAYFGLLGKRVKITVDLSFNAVSTGGSADERVRELTMWSDSWGGGDEASVTVSLVDSSTILQEITMPRVFWTDLTVGAVVWTTMDIVGLTNYNYTKDVLDSGQLVPYFYPEVDKTAWETLSDLCEGTQTALYFDEYDVLQIKTRKALFGINKPVDWNLDAIQNGQKLPDVIDASIASNEVVNKVDITYKAAHYSDFANGFPKMETAWEPSDDTVVLRASALTRDLKTTDTAFYIVYTDATTWPYSGKIDIEGEVISYNGKEYAWNGTDNAVHYDIVKSLDDQKAIDAKSNPNLAWSNKYTGKFIIDGRGVNGTVNSNHAISISNYTGAVTNYWNTKFVPVSAGSGTTVTNGYLNVHQPMALDIHDYFKVQSEAVIDSSDTTYGFRFRFPSPTPSGSAWCVGGMYFAGDWGDTGYYLEISSTDHVENLENRQWRNEFSLLAMPGNAPIQALSADNIAQEGSKGYKAAIVLDKWYSVDIRHVVQGNGDARVSIYLDGVYLGGWTVPKGIRVPDQGKFGLHIRHFSSMDVEYMYAVHGDPSADVAIDQATFLNIIDGGYSSGYIDRQWRYGPQYYTSYQGPAHEGSFWFNALNNRASYFIDEYGPVAHELREFSISFDAEKSPVSHSYLYLSNDTKAVCTNYWADPFTAKFTLANTSRENAVLAGDDDSLGPNNTIHQKMFIYGRSLYQDTETTVTKTDDQSIRANGTVQLQINSRFIETDAAANDIGQWVVDQWADGSDEVTVNIFGNPLIQLGDLVTMNYPIRGFHPSTHKYWVVSVDNSYENGLSTKLILRRARTS